MKNTIKKLLSLALALALVLGCLPVFASASGTYDRIAGDNRYETAFAAADALKTTLGAEKFENIIIASGTGFADALAGSYLAAVKRAPILLVNKHSLEEVASYVSNNLVGGGTVYLLGGEAAVPAQMEGLLSGHDVRRLAGANRYDTNLLILRAAGLGGSEILVCTGKNFADSLSASAVGKPILLVNKKLTDAQKALAATGSGKFVIIGGESAVGSEIANELAAYGSVERLAGDNRYETSVLVAEKFFPSASTAVLAYAGNYPDGLCGGPLAYAKKAPLLLTKSCNETFANGFAESKGITSGTVLGGTGLISDGSCETVFGTTAVGHVYVTTTKEPTCTENGGTSEACAKCGKVKSAGEIPATGHTNEVVETVKPQFDAEGYTKYRCETCGKAYQEAIPHPKEAREPTEMEKAVAEATIKYLKEYGASMIHSEGLTKVAQYRAYQLTEEFEHDNRKMMDACNYYRYGAFEDMTKYGYDESYNYYEGRCQEAIAKSNYVPKDADDMGHRLATIIYNSPPHWAYIGDPESPYGGVGTTYANGYWHVSVISSKVNYDNQ